MTYHYKGEKRDSKDKSNQWIKHLSGKGPAKTLKG